jgi:hypothetical protein
LSIASWGIALANLSISKSIKSLEFTRSLGERSALANNFSALNEEMLLQKLEYIHNNPVRRGYVDDPACWRYSSYRNYIDRDGLLLVDVIDC